MSRLDYHVPIGHADGASSSLFVCFYQLVSHLAIHVLPECRVHRCLPAGLLVRRPIS